MGVGIVWDGEGEIVWWVEGRRIEDRDGRETRLYSQRVIVFESTGGGVVDNVV